MGFLHEGHLSLVRVARARAEAEVGKACVVLSIFVNPTQFGPNEDYERYPRDPDRDHALAEGAGVDVVFAPDVREMYPAGFRTEVRVTGLSEPLCGAGRPGHFDGVALIVAKLLNIVRPDFTVFGQKDAQQSIVVRRLAADLDLPGEIVVAPIVREEDGVAMSSRNAYLSPEERTAARAIPRGLLAAALAYAAGERNEARLRELVRRELDREPLLKEEYVEIVGREDLGEWDGRGPALLALAARIGRTRLIDNVFLGEESAIAVPPGLANAGMRESVGGTE
jgi:pantoate--beta-alanine ligase